jgi:hypothetical protein
VTSQEPEIRRAALSLFGAWLVHDVEEVFTFPATSRLLAERVGTTKLLVTPAQSAVAIALMGALVATACHSGIRTNGDSKLFRAVSAGLEAHVATHILASVSQKRYTAGLVTAPLVMLPGARVVRAALRRRGQPLRFGDTAQGAALLMGAALLSHLVARASVGRSRQHLKVRGDDRRERRCTRVLESVAQTFDGVTLVAAALPVGKLDLRRFADHER